MNSSEKIYFKNLDGLRMIAAILVILTHCNSVLIEAGKHNFYSSVFQKAGKFGVDLFFTLSGFLISFLLMKEIHAKGSVNIRSFLIRRMLRTWPLYFATGIAGIFLGPFILNYINSGGYGQLTFNQHWQNFIHLMTFTVNFQVQYGQKNFGTVSTLWSICIEEQFYFLWPFFISFFRKRLLLLLIVVTVAGLIYYAIFPKNAHYSTVVRFYHFGMGALGAYLYLHRHSIQAVQKAASFFCNKSIQVIVILGITAIVLNIIRIPYLNTLSYGLFSLYIILISVSSSSVFNLEYEAVKYLGKISYGLYMFHLFAIQLSFHLLTGYFDFFKNWYYFVFPALSLAVTIILSALSYEVFEKYFLKKKKNFET